jgi:tetratricopeptide (TPR) repeat protein
MAILAAAAFLVFANSLHGAFIYDDTKQITGNELIQENRHLLRALTSDVWAFKGQRAEAWSNYWRPAFVLWLVANHRLFGLENPAGWHAASLLMHTGVCVLAYLLLRRLRLAVPAAFSIGLLFAVHPVHVESVAWVSGSCDPILAAALLGSLLLALPRPASIAALWGSLGLYALALLAKESAVLYPALVFAAALWLDRDPESGRGAAPSAAGGGRGEARPAAPEAATLSRGPTGERVRRALRRALPYLGVTAVYLLLHYLVIGRLEAGVRAGGGPATIVLSAPSVLWFYLKEALLPLGIGPAHPVRPVTASTLSLGNLALPLLGAGIVTAALVLLAARHPVRRFGLALFLLMLAPAFNVSAFLPEHAVQDRYLYLPLLGLLMVLVPALASGLARLESRLASGGAMEAGAAGRAGRWLLGATLALAAPLALITIRYNPVWGSERALWAASVASDPASASSRMEYAHLLFDAGRRAEALAEVDRAIAIDPQTNSFLLRSEIEIAEGRYADAVRDLNRVLAQEPASFQAYERLVLAYQSSGRPGDAEAAARRAREAVPHARGAFTDLLSVILRDEGKRVEAIAELESVRGLATTEYGTDASWILFHLGTLYREAGRPAEARAALEEYLAATTNDRAAQTLVQRREAQSLLSGLPLP